MRTASRRDLRKILFPNLIRTNYNITSPFDLSYNCISYTIDIKNCWTWPGYVWPYGVIPSDERLSTFIDFYKLHSYEECGMDTSFDPSYDKVAIFVMNNVVTHGSKQVNGAFWKSKIGSNKDIEHELDGIENNTYGRAVQIMRRMVK